MKRLLKRKEVMEYLSIGKTKFYELRERKLLKPVPLEGRSYYDIQDLELLIEKQKRLVS